MTFTVRLEQADGTPAEPPSIGSTSRIGGPATRSRSGGPDAARRRDRLHGRPRSATLIVEDAAERASSAEL